MAYLGPPPARTPVTSAQITDASVTAAKLATNSVTTVKIAADNVTTAKIAAANVTAAKVSSDVSQLGKNLIQNGAYNVAQRGTSFAAHADTYSLDRWLYSKDATAAAITVTQDTDVPAGEGFGTSIKIDVTTADASIAATDLARFTQRIEAQNLVQLKYGASGAKTMVLSFWIKSTKIGTFSIFAFSEDGSRWFNASYTVDVTNTWEYKTVTIAGDTGGTITNDTGIGLIIGWTLIAGSNFVATADTWAGNADYAASSYSMLDSTSNNILITGVQLEVGSVATDFEHEPISVTLEKCQRYFEYLSFGIVNGEPVGWGVAASTSTFLAAIPFRVVKRVAPTLGSSAAATFAVVYTGGATAAVGGIAALTAGESNLQLVGTGVAGSPLTDGASIILRRDTTDTTFISISADL